MTLENELLAIEKSLWTGGPDSYRRHLDADCLVAFTEMTGVSSRDQIAGTVSGAERWRELQTEVEGIVRPTPEVALLTYRASAVRGEGERYRALVSSGYVRRSDGWKLMFHQQAPLSD
jgi:hypothetical protein